MPTKAEQKIHEGLDSIRLLRVVTPYGLRQIQSNIYNLLIGTQRHSYDIQEYLQRQSEDLPLNFAEIVQPYATLQKKINTFFEQFATNKKILINAKHPFTAVKLRGMHCANLLNTLIKKYNLQEHEE